MSLVRENIGELSAGIAITVLFSFVAFQTYAWTDDYPHLGEPHGLLAEHASQGRLLAGPLDYVVFAAARSIDNLRYVRILGVVGLALLAAQLVSALRTMSVAAGPAVFLTTTALLLPPFQMYAGWATAWLFSWTCLLSVWGGRRWLEASTIGMRCLGLAAIVAANLMYQPAAFFVWALLGLRLTLSPDDEGLRQTGKLLFAAAVGALVAFAAAVVVNDVTHVAWRDRSALLSSVGDIEHKAAWVFTRPLVIAARPFGIDSPTPLDALLTAGPVWLLIALDWARRVRSQRKYLLLLTLVAVPLVAMLPNVLVRENQIEFRVLAGICVTVWWYACVAAYHTLRRQQWFEALRVHTGPAYVISAILVSWLALVSRRNIMTTMVEPNQQKDAYIAAQLRKFDPTQHSRIIVVNDPEWWGRRRRVGTFSLISDLALEWVPPADVRLKAREVGIDVLRTAITVQKEPFVSAANTVAIDLSPLRLGPR
jgi:hypothetical protein